VPAEEEVDVREGLAHPARERLVGGVLLERVEPDDTVSERARRAISACSTSGSPTSRPSEQLTTTAPRTTFVRVSARTASPMRVPPFQSTTSSAARRRASFGSATASARVTRVRRVPKQNPSQRASACSATRAKMTSARE
jgi:hypothetical protein